MHWRNSNFQIAYFIAGSCHTPDEAYRKLKELHEERDVAIRNALAGVKRSQAKQKRAEIRIKVADAKLAKLQGVDETTLEEDALLAHLQALTDAETERLEAEADLDEMNAFKDQVQSTYDQAIRERDFIQDLINRVEPHRRFKHLPEHEAHQMIQMDEWSCELQFRAQNYLMSGHAVPPDQLAAMRLHPKFETQIQPVLAQLEGAVKSGLALELKRPEMYDLLLKDYDDGRALLDYKKSDNKENS